MFHRIQTASKQSWCDRVQETKWGSLIVHLFTVPPSPPLLNSILMQALHKVRESEHDMAGDQDWRQHVEEISVTILLDCGLHTL